MALPGTWQFFFSWGCNGNYVGEGITFNGDGTWSSTEGFNGRWDELNGEFILNIAGYATVYAGNVEGNAGVGIQTTFAGDNGCFYMIRESPPPVPAKKAAPDLTLAGKGKKK
jgi:hypothetical protein